jgi:hypothetical protein
VFFVPGLGYIPHNLKIQTTREWGVRTSSEVSAGAGTIGKKSGRRRIYLSTGTSYSWSADTIEGAMLMNGEMIVLVLFLLRVVIPVSLLFSLGIWIERRSVP